MIPTASLPTFVVAATSVELTSPGTWVVATTSGAVSASLPLRSQSPASTGLPRVGPAVNVYQIVVLTTAKPVTVSRNVGGADTFHQAGVTTATSIVVQPGETCTIIDDGLYWVPVWSARLDPLGLGFVMTQDPRMTWGGGVLTANRCIWTRCINGGNISKIGYEVTIQFGNLSVAAYRNTGTGRTSAPGTRLATSGAVACPAAGYAETALDAAVTVLAGDWLAMSVDNATAAFAKTSPATGNINGGATCRQDTAHPAPSTPSITQGAGAVPILVGVA